VRPRASGLTAVPGVRAAVVAHARRTRPAECCGLLVGRGRRVEFAVPMRNTEASPTRFRLDDEAHLELRRVLRPFVPALRIVGVYHSHPGGGPVPSARDVAEAMYPDWLYVIVGLTPRPRVRAYRIRNGRARGVAVRWR
jgi:proteasome lid subunit RPN8/RPN11